MTDNSPVATTRRAVALEDGDVEAGPETMERRAASERLVLAADSDRRQIERELHEGVQQHLIALAVNLQLASQLLDTEPAAAAELLERMRGDVRKALDETVQLAERVYPPLLEAGLAPALRAAVAATGRVVAVEVDGTGRYPPAIARTVYLSCLESLAGVGKDARATISIREEGGDVRFDVTLRGADSAPPRLLAVRDRIEALGGRLCIASEPDGATRVSGSLPLAR